MTLEEFINKKQPIWSELEKLLNRTRRHHIGSASPTQLSRLGYLYRRITSDLAVARRDFPDDRCVPYLNTLASRAHTGIYQTSPLKRNTIRHFFGSGFPTLFRSNLRFIAAAFCCSLLGLRRHIGRHWWTLNLRKNSRLNPSLIRFTRRRCGRTSRSFREISPPLSS